MAYKLLAQIFIWTELYFHSLNSMLKYVSLDCDLQDVDQRETLSH